MGHHNWACLTLEALLRAGHEIVGVVAETDEFDNKYCWSEKYLSVKEVALSHNLSLYQPPDINSRDFFKKINDLNPNLIVSVSYHSIIREPILDKYTIINAHGSLLPKYRGRTPINWAIINGEKETGVTVHYVTKKIDAGDIILQKKISIEPNETAGDICEKILPLYPKLITEAVNLIEKGKAPRVPQDNTKATNFGKRTPDDGLIDWAKSSKDIHNWIRALSRPYPGAFTFRKGKKIFIWKSSLVDKKYNGLPGEVVDYLNNEPVIMTGKGALILEDLEIKNGATENLFT